MLMKVAFFFLLVVSVSLAADDLDEEEEAMSSIPYVYPEVDEELEILAREEQEKRAVGAGAQHHRVRGQPGLLHHRGADVRGLLARRGDQAGKQDPNTAVPRVPPQTDEPVLVEVRGWSFLVARGGKKKTH